MDEYLEILAGHGVDVERLRNFEVTAPPVEFLATPAGHRWKEAARSNRRQPLRGLTLGVWGSLYSEGEAASMLAESGVTEALLMQVLKELPAEPPKLPEPISQGTPLEVMQTMRRMFRVEEPPFDVPDVELSLPAREVLLVAWDLCGRREVQTYDVLAGLLVVGVSIEAEVGALGILKKLAALEDLNHALSLTPRMTLIVETSEPEAVRFSQQVRRMLGLAQEASGGQAETGHLLFGLAALAEGEAHRILAAIGVSAERIRLCL